MTGDQAHSIACRLFGDDPRIRALLRTHGNALSSSLSPPSTENGGQWVELVLLDSGEANFVDDPRGSSVVLARCIINPDTGQGQVLIAGSAEPTAAPDRDGE